MALYKRHYTDKTLKWRKALWGGGALPPPPPGYANGDYQKTTILEGKAVHVWLQNLYSKKGLGPFVSKGDKSTQKKKKKKKIIQNNRWPEDWRVTFYFYEDILLWNRSVSSSNLASMED